MQVHSDNDLGVRIIGLRHVTLGALGVVGALATGAAGAGGALTGVATGGAGAGGALPREFTIMRAEPPGGRLGGLLGNLGNVGGNSSSHLSGQANCQTT